MANKLVFPAFIRGMLCAALLFVAGGSVAAAEKLRFGHGYETSIAYHKWALWAADEIKKRTDGRYEVDVFPQSQLGVEEELDEGISLGTIDMGYIGSSFLANVFPPIQIHLAAFLWKDYEHFQKYQGSAIQKKLMAGYEKESGNKLVALTYYGSRHVTSNKPILTPADMVDLKIRVPTVPVYEIFPRSAGASPTPIAFPEVYLALQQGVVDAQENPLPTIKAKKFYEVQKHISLTGHMTDGFYTVIGKHLWDKLSTKDKQIFLDVYREAAEKCGLDIRASELELGDWFRAQGVQVHKVNREPFKKAALPYVLSDDYGWTPDQIREILALAE